jgi:hypothetical protein
MITTNFFNATQEMIAKFEEAGKTPEERYEVLKAHAAMIEPLGKEEAIRICTEIKSYFCNLERKIRHH